MPIPIQVFILLFCKIAEYNATNIQFKSELHILSIVISYILFYDCCKSLYNNYSLLDGNLIDNID